MSSLARVLARLPWRALAIAAFAVSVALFVASLPTLADGDWGRLATSFGHHAWVLGWVLALSFLARSRGLYNVTAAFLGGYFTAIWLSVTVGNRTGEWLGVNDPWQYVVAVPLIEEVAKVLPVLLVAAIWWRRTDGALGVVDLTVLGVAAGSGFAIHEDAMWTRISGSGFDSPLGWLLPTAHTDAGLVAGHAVWTGLVGLAIGLWFAHRSRRWTALLPVAALILVVADHGFWNDLGLRAEWRTYLLDGWLVIGLFGVGLVVAMVHETWQVHRLTSGRALSVARVIPVLLTRARSPWNLWQRWYQLTLLIRLMALRCHQVTILGRMMQTMRSTPDPVEVPA